MDYSKTLLFMLICVLCSGYALCFEPISFERYAGSSLDVQKATLAKAFRERVSHAQNLYYENTIDLEVRKNENGNEGEVDEKSRVRKSYSHWQLKEDYRMRVAICPGNSIVPFQWVDLAWDAREGILKNTFQAEEIKGRIFGRIDTQLDRIVGFNGCFTYWLQGGALNTQPHSYLFSHLLENEAQWDIVCLMEEGRVRLSYKFDFKLGGEAMDNFGETALLLDPDKGFMPISGMTRFTSKLGNGRELWTEESFYVEESQAVAHVWMPTRLKAVTHSVALPDKFSIRKVNVTDIKHGSVTRADVSLKFPEGTEVTDAINGIAYKTDARGNPIQSTIEPLYGLDPSQVKMPEPPKSKINLMLMTIGILMIIIGLYLAIVKRLRSSS